MAHDPRMPARWLKMALVPLMLAALAACATPFKADVQRFTAQLPAPQGQTFTVVADDAALAGGLEFAQYARLVEGQMAKQGYTPASPEQANLLVRFDYGVDKGREKVTRSMSMYRDPFWGPWYGGYGYRPYYSPFYRPSRMWGYGWYDPFFDNGYESYTIYTSGIQPEDRPQQPMATACSKARPKPCRARTACRVWCRTWSTRSSPASRGIRARRCGLPSATAKIPCAPPNPPCRRSRWGGGICEANDGGAENWR